MFSILAMICFSGFTGTQEVYGVSLRSDGAGQCCHQNEPNPTDPPCVQATPCSNALTEPRCCADLSCGPGFDYSVCQAPYADCRGANCFCQIQLSLFVTEASPCVDDALVGEVRPDDQWMRWLVLRPVGEQGQCGPLP